MNTSPAEFQIIIGKRPWRVLKGIGSFLLFEFGRTQRNEDNSRSGTYTLWIYMADWRIRYAGRELAHSESPDKTINKAAGALTRKTLEGIILQTVILKDKLRYAATFRFENGYILQALMYEAKKHKNDPIFMLYTPSTLLSYNSRGGICSEPITRK